MAEYEDTKPDGGPLYPRTAHQENFGDGTFVRDLGASGVSLRDHIAIEIFVKSLHGLIISEDKFDYSWQHMAESAYAAADAMVKEREK